MTLAEIAPSKKDMEFIIKSDKSDNRLRFFGREKDYFNFVIEGPKYFASLQVCSYTDEKGIQRLFNSIADNWRGWQGEMTWESIEGEFKISCQMNKTGHVFINVALREVGIEEEWRFSATVVVMAGQLSALAEAANRFFSA